MNCSIPAFTRICYYTLGLLVCFSQLTFAQASKEIFVCSPCSRDCDKLTFNKSGTCPHCNMALVRQGEGLNEKKAKQVAILLFEGVQIIDFTGPFEVLGQA